MSSNERAGCVGLRAWPDYAAALLMFLVTSAWAANEPPTLDPIADVAVLEDSGPATVNLTGITVGLGDPPQTLTVTATSSDTNVVPDPGVTYTSPDPTGTLIITPVVEAYGAVTITVTVQDDGGGGTDTITRQFTLTVTPVNDAPAFTVGPDQYCMQNAGQQNVPNCATSFNPGPANEASQSLLQYVVTNDNNALFSVQPTVANDGTLTYTPAPGAFGAATVTVRAQDDGGTDDGGLDASDPQTFTVTVFVNAAPTLDPIINVVVLEDSGAANVNLAGITVGPGNPPQTLTVTATSSNTSIIPDPAVAYTSPDPTGTLTITPNPDAYGVVTITVTVRDDGGGTDTTTRQFSVTVTPVNDAPTFTRGPDQYCVQNGGPQAIGNWATGFSAGPANEAGQSILQYIVTNDNNALFSVQPAVANDGTLTYIAAPDAFSAATVTVRVQDDGGTDDGGVDTSDTQTFVVTVFVNAPPTLSGVHYPVAAFGGNEYGQCDPPSGLNNITAIAAGEHHTVALRNDGSVVAWGRNSTGQCSVPEGAQSGVVAISAGVAHTVALKSDGSVIAWGYNDMGQCNVPEGAQSGVTAIAAGAYYTLALKSDGSVIAWGQNYNGQCTVPDEAQYGVTAVAGGWWHAVALKSDGSVIGWGDNEFGQCTAPSAARSGVIAITAGGSHTVALKADGSVIAWGYTGDGECAVPVGAQSGVTAISAGAGHTVALKNDGSVIVWGFNDVGQCSVPDWARNGAESVAAGGWHTVVLKPAFEDRQATVALTGISSGLGDPP